MEKFDLVIKNGRIIDGTGNPWFYGDIGIRKDKIVQIGRIKDPKVIGKIIDAEGLFVSPGFIDIHAHSEFTLLINGLAESKIRQGVTTEIVGNCGFSAAPVNKDGSIYYGALEMKSVAEKIKPDWSDIKGYFKLLKSQGVSVNIGTLLGHNNIRVAVMGQDNRKPTSGEIGEMKKLVEKAVKDGVLGLSTGLSYGPGCFSEKDEVIELCKVFSGHGIYASHIRSLNDTIIEASEEAIEIGEKAGMAIQISHYVPCYPYWHKADGVINVLKNARKRGIDVTCDFFPYIIGNVSLKSLCPPWAFEGGNKKLVERLKIPEIREKIKEDTLKFGSRSGGSFKRALIKDDHWDKIWLSHCNVNSDLIGMNFKEIAEKKETDPFNALFDILIEESGVASVVAEDRCEEDVEYFMKHPLSMIASDGYSLAPYGILGEGKQHPRSYGTFTRAICEYVKKKELINLEEVIKKMTLFPAKRFGIKKRGQLEEGFYADIVIYDYDELNDLASMVNPHCYPEGIHYVIVNGKVTIEKNQHLNIKNGKILTK